MDETLQADAWEKAHAAREWGTYPNEHLVRFVARNYYSVPDRSKVRFLDMGCGSGASSRYLSQEGFHVTAIDRSLSALRRLEDWMSLQVRYPVIDSVQGDLEYVEFSPVFDCLIDVCSLQHVREPLLVLGRCTKWLKPGGKIFSIWASEGHDKEVAEAPSGHCWRLSSADVSANFAVFKRVDSQISAYTDRGRSIAHWLITGNKD